MPLAYDLPLSPSVGAYVDASRAHRLDGIPIPSVTQVLKAAGLSSDFSMVPIDILERKRQIGQAVHAATHYFDDGDLDEATIAPEVVPYLDAWKRLRDDRALEPELLETVVCSRLFHFIGRFDRLCRILRGPARRILLDLKIGDPDAAAADLQTAGYEVALREEHPELGSAAIERWSVQLCPDGRYRLRQYPLSGRSFRQDRSEFLAAVTVINARTARNGGKPCWM